MYYRGANAALLLYDITNASTFEDVKGWLEGMLFTSMFLLGNVSAPTRAQKECDQ